jgi:hypothetical protein
MTKACLQTGNIHAEILDRELLALKNHPKFTAIRRLPDRLAPKDFRGQIAHPPHRMSDAG